jgi:hypothetical protein
MKLAKAFKHALNLVMHSKLRSWLTVMFGIEVGHFICEANLM